MRKIRFFLLSALSLTVAGLVYYAVKRASYVPSNQVGDRRLKLPYDGQGLVFFAVGDTGTGDAKQYRTAELMEQRCLELGGIDALLLLGDNFYKVGVSSTEDEQWQTKIEKPFGGPCLSKAPIYPILGNHDYKGNPGAQIEYSKHNPRWHMPARFYAADYGSFLRIIAVDTGFPDFCFSAEHCSVDFLLQQAKEGDFTWRLAMGHHPLTSSRKAKSLREPLVESLFRPLLCENLDIYMSGHSHHLEYRNIEGCQTHFFVSGGGGADLYEIDEQAEGSHYAKSIHGFLELKLNEQEMTAAFHTPHGSSPVFTQTKP